MEIEDIIATLDPLQQIGRGAEGNGNYQRQLADAIQQTKKPVEQFTLAEMLALIQHVKIAFNSQRQFSTVAELTFVKPN